MKKSFSFVFSFLLMTVPLYALGDDPCKARERELLNRNSILEHVLELVTHNRVKPCLEELYKIQQSGLFTLAPGNIHYEDKAESLRIWKLDYYLTDTSLDDTTTLTLVIREQFGPFEAGSVIEGCSLDSQKQ
jgi:hypothetical protein